jgi:hypothetical protein
VSTIHLERTLVKSPPELWEELSQIERWLGDVEVSRQEPPSRLAWSARGARGTIELEPSGWGTKVSAHAETTGSGLLDRFRGAEPVPDLEQRLSGLLDHLGSSSLTK